MTSFREPRSSFPVFIVSIGVFALVVSATLLLAACAVAPVRPAESASSDQSKVSTIEAREEKSGRSRADVITLDSAMANPPRQMAARASRPQLLAYSHGQTFLGDWNTERYDSIEVRGFTRPVDVPLSTFSIDVDTASYANVRRFLRDRMRPPHGAVRIEEMVNYFRYRPLAVEGAQPFSVETEIFVAPWAPENRLVRIGIHGHELSVGETPARNMVFLIDVSGSMHGADRLDLVKHGLAELTRNLRSIDRVSIVVYAGASGLVLPPTSGADQAQILEALGRLEAGGSTRGAAGIRLAYETATQNFDPTGINRVILATDGDFNVGVTSRSELVRLIEEKRESGVFLTVLGFGRGNLNDSGMEALADKGNGNYAYIDGKNEARKVLVEQANATLITIAKDVKIQVEFNPARVAAYRLIGYENRRIEDRDFNDDKKDAGEIGAGHHVTALYEIIPVGRKLDPAKMEGSVDPLKYQASVAATESAASNAWLTVKLRYKEPTEAKSRLLTSELLGAPHSFEGASENGRFSAAVVLFGMLLRDSEYKGQGSFEMVQSLGRQALGRDDHGERAEFLQLVALAKNLDDTGS